MLKVFISAERLTKTAEKYQMLSYKLDGWQSEIAVNKSRLDEANSGAYAEAFSESTSVFMNSLIHGFMEKTDCMLKVLVESRTRVKALLARRDDFVNILQTGEDAFTSEEYASCAVGPNDQLYFDDEYCKEEASYSGLIRDNTELVEARSVRQEKDVEELEECIARLKAIELNVGDHADNIRECAKKQKRVRPLLDSLEVYCRGVKEFNDYVGSQFSVYLSLLSSNKARVRTFDYEGDTGNKNLIYTALLQREGVGAEEIGMVEDTCGIDKKEFYDNWQTMDAANKSFVSDNLRGNYDAAFGMKPRLISNDSLKIAACLHAGLLGKDDPENAGEQYNNMLNAICGAGLGYMSRMALASQKALAENNINHEALTKICEQYLERSRFRLKI